MRQEPVADVQREVSARFGVPAPTIYSQFGQGPAVVLSRLSCDEFGHGASKTADPEDAYVLHVMLKDVEAYDLRFRGQRAVRSSARREAVFMGSLRQQPTASLDTPFDLVRIYVTQAALDEHAASIGRKGRVALRMKNQGALDPALSSLIHAVLPAFVGGAESGQLFVDSISLSIQDHLVRAYGDDAGENRDASGGLAPWLERRAKEFIESRLTDGASLEEVAGHCDLSPSHFSKAFRVTTGLPPHRWLLERRIEKAKTLLAEEGLALGEIALLCGFSDASHFSRTFSQLAHEPPAAWRRRNRS